MAKNLMPKAKHSGEDVWLSVFGVSQYSLSRHEQQSCATPYEPQNPYSHSYEGNLNESGSTGRCGGLMDSCTENSKTLLWQGSPWSSSPELWWECLSLVIWTVGESGSRSPARKEWTVLRRENSAWKVLPKESPWYSPTNRTIHYRSGYKWRGGKGGRAGRRIHARGTTVYGDQNGEN